MNILITCPHFHIGGGVANYFEVVGKYFSINSVFFSLGAAASKESFVNKLSHFRSDEVRFSSLLDGCSQNIDLVHINPSFRYAALIRDGLILKDAKRFGKKTVIFFHGWSHGIANLVDKYFRDLFFSVYNRVDAFVVLASEFECKLRDWGFEQPIYLETTPVDDELLVDFSIDQRVRTNKTKKDLRVLFLSRIEKEKGICETLEAVNILTSLNPTLNLAVAGDGLFLQEAQKLTVRLGLKDKVQFLGYVKGVEKKEAFRNSDIYVFPTTHAEGMPTSVLEAMAFGLPVITRPVGGLKDFFLDGKFGFITESRDPAIFASLIEKLIRDRDLSARMSMNCHQYAKERFMASKVAKRLEDIYRKTVEG